ncbi:MAG: carboxypeptidase-like regulatory domain-containing protein [Saprospiraceae bacterium]
MKKISTLLLIALLVNLSLTAQNMLEGSIMNAEGESLVATVITMQHATDAQLTKAITTDENGYFFLDNLANGAYTLVVENIGYQTLSMSDFQFPRDTDKVVGLTLENLDVLIPTVLTTKRNDQKDNIASSNVY